MVEQLWWVVRFQFTFLCLDDGVSTTTSGRGLVGEEWVVGYFVILVVQIGHVGYVKRMGGVSAVPSAAYTNCLVNSIFVVTLVVGVLC